MKEKIIAILKTPAAIISGIIGILLLVIKFLSNKNKTLGAQVEGAEASKRDAVLEQQQLDLSEQHKKDIAALEVEKQRKLTQEEMVDFLKKI